MVCGVCGRRNSDDNTQAHVFGLFKGAAAATAHIRPHGNCNWALRDTIKATPSYGASMLVCAVSCVWEVLGLFFSRLRSSLLARAVSTHSVPRPHGVVCNLFSQQL